MARIAFTFSYQAFARYVRDNCDSEQEIDGSRVDERWLYNNMEEYLRARAGHLYEFSWDKFIPTEFHTGQPGGQTRIDLIGTRRRNAEDGVLAMVLEAKLMVDDRKWAQEIIWDLLRVACVKARTNRRTQRYVMVVGQERCWTKAVQQCGGLLPKLFPMERRRDPKIFWLRPKRKWTKFSESWRKQHEEVVQDYLVPLLPAGIEVELIGCSRSNRGLDEQPEAGITTRLWRVYPR